MRREPLLHKLIPMTPVVKFLGDLLQPPHPVFVYFLDSCDRIAYHIFWFLWKNTR